MAHDCIIDPAATVSAILCATALLGSSAAFFGCAPVPRAPLDDGWGPVADSAERQRPAGSPLAPAPRAVVVPPEKRVRWRYADRAARLQAVPGREPSEHMSGRFERTVRINSLAAGYLQLAGGQELPQGALIVQDHRLPGESALTVSFAMTKLAPGSSPATGDWAFAVLDAEEREATAGDLSLCARCHAAAPHHGLFGPAADPAGRQSGLQK